MQVLKDEEVIPIQLPASHRDKVFKLVCTLGIEHIVLKELKDEEDAAAAANASRNMKDMSMT